MSGILLNTGSGNGLEPVHYRDSNQDSNIFLDVNAFQVVICKILAMWFWPRVHAMMLEQNGHNLADNTFKYISWQICLFLIQILLNFVPKDVTDNKSVNTTLGKSLVPNRWQAITSKKKKQMIWFFVCLFCFVW